MTAPQMQKFDNGPPISKLDLEYKNLTGKKPRGRVVPRDRDYNKNLNDKTLDQFEVVKPETLHAEAKSGRPLKFDLETAKQIKTAYWEGETTIAALAQLHNTTKKTIARIIHSETYWYI